MQEAGDLTKCEVLLRVNRAVLMAACTPRRCRQQRLQTAAHGGGSEPAEEQDWSRTAISAGLFALWAGVLGQLLPCVRHRQSWCLDVLAGC